MRRFVSTLVVLCVGAFGLPLGCDDGGDGDAGGGGDGDADVDGDVDADVDGDAEGDADGDGDADGGADAAGDADGETDGCEGSCIGLSCGEVGSCGPCGRDAAPAVATSVPTDREISMEGTLHAKQDKIVVTSDGTVHLYVQYHPQGAAYVRSHDGGVTWVAEQLLGDRGWLGELVADQEDNLYVIFASSWREGGVYMSSPMAAMARVDKSSTPWTWTWDTPTPLLPHPPNPRNGFLSFACDSQGIFHLVTASTEAFSFDHLDEPVPLGINYFRSAPYDIRSFELVEQLLATEIWPVEVPGFALGYGGDPTVELDAEDNVILVYSDRSLFQSGLQQDQWPDAGFRGTLYYERHLRTETGWEPSSPQVIARGAYGDVDTLTEPDGTTHIVYTVVNDGSDYRVAYRRITPEGAMGEELFLTEPDDTAVERTIFPSLARLDDGTLVVGFNDRLADPAGILSMVVAPEGSSFGCAHHVVAVSGGSLDMNLYPHEADGHLLFVYRTGSTEDRSHMRFASVATADILAAFGVDL